MITHKENTHLTYYCASSKTPDMKWTKHRWNICPHLWSVCNKTGIKSHSWRAAASCPGTFTLIVKAPPTGRVQYQTQTFYCCVSHYSTKAAKNMWGWYYLIQIILKSQRKAYVYILIYIILYWGVYSAYQKCRIRGQTWHHTVQICRELIMSDQFEALKQEQPV